MRREDYTILVDSPSPKPPTSHDNNGQGVRVGEAMRRVVKKTLGGQTSTASDAVDSFYYLKILYLKQGHVGYYSHIDFFLMEVNATKSRLAASEDGTPLLQHPETSIILIFCLTFPVVATRRAFLPSSSKLV